MTSKLDEQFIYCGKKYIFVFIYDQVKEMNALGYIDDEQSKATLKST
jgi:hypothetical protein